MKKLSKGKFQNKTLQLNSKQNPKKEEGSAFFYIPKAKGGRARHIIVLKECVQMGDWGFKSNFMASVSNLCQNSAKSLKHILERINPSLSLNLFFFIASMVVI